MTETTELLSATTAAIGSTLETLTRELMENLPEYSVCLDCVSWNYDTMEFKFRDEDGSLYSPSFDALVKGVTMEFDRLVAAGHHTLDVLLDAGQWDANNIDNAVQFAIFGELVYG